MKYIHIILHQFGASKLQFSKFMNYFVFWLKHCLSGSLEQDFNGYPNSGGHAS